MINKKIFMIVGIILLAAGATYAAGVVFFGGNAHEDITDGLVLSVDLTQDNYIAGTKTFTDDSSKKHDLASANVATFTTDKYGKSTGAMVFSGTNDYLANSANEPLNDKWTIAWWQYKKSVQGTLPTPIFIDDTSDGSDLWIYPTGNNLVLDRNSGGACSWDGVLSSDVWQHIVITFNFNSSQYTTIAYINGVQQGVRTFPHLNMSVNNFLFGSYYGSFPFNGSISEIKIWNRDLSAAEVQTLYNSSKPKMSASSIESGLVGHWTLDDESYNSATNRIDDKTPYSNHGTNSGVTLTTDRMGQSNGAMSFDGENDYVNISYRSELMLTNDFTISAWVKTSVAPGTSYPAIDEIISDRDTQSPYEGYFLGITGNEGSIEASCGAFYYGGVITSGAGISTNIWHHLACTYDDVNNVMRVYVDGVQLGINSSFDFNFPDTGKSITIGRDPESSVYLFNGSIADVRIYNRALSQTEINTLYNSYNPKVASDSLQKGLVFDMPLTSSYTSGGAAGSEVIDDRTPYSNDGQNYGATVGSDYTSFDGGDDYVSVSLTLPLMAGTTISTWLYIPSGISDHIGIFDFTTTTSGIYIHYFNSLSKSLYFVPNNWQGGDIGASIMDVGDMWSHWVITTFGSTVNLYKNGVLMSTAETLATSSVSLSAFGKFPASSVYNFSGKISSLKIYNRALSESEIKSLYDKGR